MQVAEAEARRDSAEAEREARAAHTHEDSLAAMAGLQASYDDSLARLRAAQEAEAAALRSRVTAAEDRERAATADAGAARTQAVKLQVCVNNANLISQPQVCLHDPRRGGLPLDAKVWLQRCIAFPTLVLDVQKVVHYRLADERDIEDAQ